MGWEEREFYLMEEGLALGYCYVNLVELARGGLSRSFTLRMFQGALGLWRFA